MEQYVKGTKKFEACDIAHSWIIDRGAYYWNLSSMSKYFSQSVSDMTRCVFHIIDI
jgi:hypothetical protein